MNCKAYISQYFRIVHGVVCYLSLIHISSHEVIEKYIDKNGEDYRYEDKESPVKALRDRKHDNTEVGRG